MLVMLAKMNFCSKAIKLPMEWSEPGDHYPKAFQPGEEAVPPNQPLNLFREESLNKYHVDSAGDVGKQFETYIEGICGAIHGAVDQWRQMATIAGRHDRSDPSPRSALSSGSPLTPLIMAQGPKGTPQEMKYTTAIANAFGTAWLPWQCVDQSPGVAVVPGVRGVSRSRRATHAEHPHTPDRSRFSRCEPLSRCVERIDDGQPR